MSLDLLESEVWTGSQDWTQDLVGGVQTWESKLGSLEFRLGSPGFQYGHGSLDLACGVRT